MKVLSQTKNIKYINIILIDTLKLKKHRGYEALNSYEFLSLSIRQVCGLDELEDPSDSHSRTNKYACSVVQEETS